MRLAKMGKMNPYSYTDSEETEKSENTESSLENLKKKRKPSSILKYTSANVKKKKCRIHSKSDVEDSDFRSRSASRTSQKEGRKKLKGILKMDKDRERAERERERDRYRDGYGFSSATDDDSEPEPVKKQSIHRYLVGRVPRPAGSKPGRGGGVAIIVKKNVKSNNMVPTPQTSTHKTKKSKNKRRSF